MNYKQFHQRLKKINDISNACSVLSWDAETYMPPKSHKLRGQQVGTLSSLAHEMLTNRKFGDEIQKLLEDETLSENERKNVEIIYNQYLKAKKIPSKFVEEIAALTTEAHPAWVKAKAASDFSVFAPYLKKVASMTKQKAELLGYDNHPYDALIDGYDRGMTCKKVEEVFEKFLPGLKNILQKVQGKPAARVDFLEDRAYPVDTQMQLSKMLSAAIGFDYTRGRLDTAAHPFSTSFHPDDVRMTTRLDEYKLFDGIGSTLHESGHSMHSQGLLTEYYGLPQGEYTNLSTAESQSRIWENNIGRSRAFVSWMYPILRATFPVQFSDVSEDECYAGLNIVKPDFIRVEADELTYHMHIVLRFEAEKAMITGELEVDDLPDFWNAKMKEYLGVDVPNDTKGCLQDVHWAHGSMGYFPTYSFGTMYAAQYDAAMRKEMDVDTLAAMGNFTPMKKWLNKNIHEAGDLYGSSELCKKVTGEGLNPNYLLRYLEAKFL